MEQCSASGYPDASGLVTLPDGSSLPREYLEGPAPIVNSEHASRTEGKKMDTDALEAPGGIALGISVSPKCRDLTLEAAEQPVEVDESG